METKQRLPSFFVIGAQKAGTTALHDWLVQQPDVCLPDIKETHFFSHDERWKQGVDWYLRQYSDAGAAGAIRGEVDPEYLFFGQAALRLRDLTVSPKFVVLLRQPLERAYSHYLMSVRRGYEDLPFAEALAAEPGRIEADQDGHALNHQSYLSRGMYSRQIARYQALFPDGQFLFVKFDDLVSKSEGDRTYRRICDFIGVASSPALAQRGKKSNQASVPRSRLLRDLLYPSRPSPLRKIVGGVIRSSDIKLRLSLWLDKLNQQPAKDTGRALDHPVPAEILVRIRDEITEVERITGFACDDWMRRTEPLAE